MGILGGTQGCMLGGIMGKLEVWPEPSEWLVTNTTAAYLRGPESASIEIPPFRPHFIKSSKTVSYEVNLSLQCSHLEVLLLNNFWSEMGDFN